MIITDEGIQYMKNRAKSYLTTQGYYHFWVNHSLEYVHKKFPFVVSSQIERQWYHLKMENHHLVCGQAQDLTIQQKIDMWALSKIVRTHKQREFTLKLINRKFFNLCARYRANKKYDEAVVPMWTFFQHAYRGVERLTHDQFTFEAHLEQNYLLVSENRLLKECEFDPSVHRLLAKELKIPMSQLKDNKLLVLGDMDVKSSKKAHHSLCGHKDRGTDVTCFGELQFSSQSDSGDSCEGI